MERLERWHMYLKIQQLKKLGLNISQIARYVGVSRNTVYKYINMTPDNFNTYLEEVITRKKKLDKYNKEMLQWLKEYPDISAAQVLDWLEERYGNIDVSEGTVRNYVNALREEYDIPKQAQKREYEAIEDPPMGCQMQADFGEIKLVDKDSNLFKLWFITFVLSYSRYKYVEWLDRPFTTADLIRTHENAFSYFGGMSQEIVYDQDHLVVVSENHGDLILTREFATYFKKRDFKIYICRKSDPESKGRVENVVGFVKKNFAKHRIYHNLDKLNEECWAWLERRGNGKKHHTTKKIPAEVFAVETQYLKPVQSQIDTTKSTIDSITRVVRKDNTLVYLSNRYSLPLGTYNGNDRQVKITVITGDVLVITDSDTGKEITRHRLCYEKGQLIKNINHSRDRSKGIAAYIEQVAGMLGDSTKAQKFLGEIRLRKSRYIRDQLQLIRQSAVENDPSVITKALDYCLKYRLYSAADFKDSLAYFQNNLAASTKQNDINTEIKSLETIDLGNRKIKPQTRDIKVYQQVMNGGCHGTDNSVKAIHENT